MRKILMTAVALMALSAPAHAVSYTYVGSWQVDDGPSWTIVPPAYTGQEAAALLFGGSASSYAISTLGSMVASINNLTWVSTYGSDPSCSGFPCGTQVAENSVISTGGLYASLGDQSAFVTDWAVGSEYTNYAFRVSGAVPEPATWGMMLVGFGAMGCALRARRKPIVRFV